LLDVTLALGADMLVLGRLAPDVASARTRLQAALDQGHAAERFARMVCALGGPVSLLEQADQHLVAAPECVPVPALRGGVVAAHATRDIGVAVIELGGGRRKAADAIDHRVGLVRVLAPGTPVQIGEALAWVHAADASSAEHAVAALQRFILVADEAMATGPVLIEHLV
jgi:thymidine phosphorylase